MTATYLSRDRPLPAAWLPPARTALLAAAGAAIAAWTLAMVLAVSGAVDMTRGEVILITLRVFIPLVILRWWVAGGIAAMLLDGGDVILVEAIGLGGFGDHYAETDKLLDSWYLGLELWVALTWSNPWARWTAAALFVFRALGVVVFEATHARIALFIFPNLFENWWLYCAMVMKWRPALAPTGWRSTAIILAALLVPKMAQEYLLHFAEAKPWDWTKRNILEPAGLGF